MLSIYIYLCILCQFLVGSIVPGDAVSLGKLGGGVQGPGSHRHYLMLRLWQALQSNNEVMRDLSS